MWFLPVAGVLDLGGTAYPPAGQIDSVRPNATGDEAGADWTGDAGVCSSNDCSVDVDRDRPVPIEPARSIVPDVDSNMKVLRCDRVPVFIFRSLDRVPVGGGLL